MTKVSDCYKAVEFTEKTYGKVDILVANAATWSMFSFWICREEEYDKVMNTDLKENISWPRQQPAPWCAISKREDHIHLFRSPSFQRRGRNRYDESL